MSKLVDTKEEFSFIKRGKSFARARRGIYVFLRTTPNAWIQLALLIIAIALGIYFGITSTEWVLLILTAGLVLASEAFNTAIEIDMNLTSPQYHPYARDTKDVAAGAVLISSIAAFLVGILIFWKYLF